MARRACQVEWPVSTLTLQFYQSCWTSHSEASGWRKNAFRSQLVSRRSKKLEITFDLHWIAKKHPKTWLYIARFNLWNSGLPKSCTNSLWRQHGINESLEFWSVNWLEISLCKNVKRWSEVPAKLPQGNSQRCHGLFVSFQRQSRAFLEGHAACTGRSFFSVSTETTPDRANGDTGSWVESVVKFKIASLI